MFSKEEAKEFNAQFWNAFHKRMRGKKSSNGRSIPWINYPSDVKDVYVRLTVNKSFAAVNYDLQFKDLEIRAIVWEQLTEMKKVMESTMGNTGVWMEKAENEDGLDIARVQWKLDGVNYYRKEDHEKIYVFFEEVMVKFDLFYQEFKEILINLV
jgi:glutamine synthetase type III